MDPPFDGNPYQLGCKLTVADRRSLSSLVAFVAAHTNNQQNNRWIIYSWFSKKDGCKTDPKCPCGCEGNTNFFKQAQPDRSESFFRSCRQIRSKHQVRDFQVFLFFLFTCIFPLHFSCQNMRKIACARAPITWTCTSRWSGCTTSTAKTCPSSRAECQNILRE